MNKKINTVIVAMLLWSVGYAQGIHFEDGKTWEQVKQQAQKEHKYIFMDCFATWCGPCKWMSANIFSKKEVGDFMNAHFINVEVQMDKTESDNEEIKKLVCDANVFKSKYSINAYPTYLFFTPDGKAVHRIVGSVSSWGRFLGKVKEALDPDEQYYTIIEHISEHKNDSSYLHTLLQKADQTHDTDNGAVIANFYIQAVKMPLLWENLRMTKHYIVSSNSSTFKFFLANAERIDSVLEEPGDAEKYIAYVLDKKDVQPLFEKDWPIDWQKTVLGLKKRYPQLNRAALDILRTSFILDVAKKDILDPYFPDNSPPANWKAINTNIHKRYLHIKPRLLDSIIAKEKYRYYGAKKMWSACDQALLAYIDHFGHFSSNEINDICWNYVFMHSDNKELLLKAAELQKQYLESPGDMDTYADLLYRAGDKQKAILWETKALSVLSEHFDPNSGSQQEDKASFEVTLARMKKGESILDGRNKRGNYDKL